MLSAQLNVTAPESEDAGMARLSEFRRLALRVVEAGAKAGVSITPFASEELPFFSKLGIDAQAKVNQRLTGLLEHCSSFEGEGWELRETKRMVWFTALRLGLRPPSDLLDLIGDEDVVEIHGAEGQVFRSFSYFNFCSYSLEELESLHFSELYIRDVFVEQQILNAVQRALTSPEIQVRPLSDHVIQERASARRYHVEHAAQYVVPLAPRGSIAATHFLVTIRAKLLDAPQGVSESTILMENLVRALGAQ